MYFAGMMIYDREVEGDSDMALTFLKKYVKIASSNNCERKIADMTKVEVRRINSTEMRFALICERNACMGWIDGSIDGSYGVGWMDR